MRQLRRGGQGANLQELLRLAQAQYGAQPTFTVQLIVVSGILHWNYEVQVYVGAGRL